MDKDPKEKDQEITKVKDEDVKNKKDTYSSLEYNEILSESIERRKEIKTLRDSLKGFEAEKTKRTEKDLEATDLLVKRDAEIALLKTDALQKGLVSKATTQLLEAGFPAKFLTVALPNNLTEDTLTQQVKDFKKEFSEYVVKPDTDKKPTPTNNPFQPGAVETPDKPKAVTPMGEAAQEMLNQN